MRSGDFPFARSLLAPGATALFLSLIASTALAACDDFRLTRNAYFGDLHIHTSYSHDAFAFSTSGEPADAYASALGQLDFAAVTDHAEFLAETDLCATPGSPGYDTPICQDLRTGKFSISELKGLCGGDEPIIDPAVCADVLADVWGRTQDAASDADQPCDFTTFVAFEYSLTTVTARRHRNVVFANANVPGRPFDSLDYPTPLDLWTALTAECLDLPGCGALAIPHTSNVSQGLMFSGLGSDGNPLTLAEAQTRATLEPLIELFQHKGNSECRLGTGVTDEQCQFEQLIESRMLPPGATEVPPRSFVRAGLKEGLSLYRSLGVNPYRLGFIGGTDTHNGTGGEVVESSFDGHLGNRDNTAEKRISNETRRTYNPGGLAGVWAQENTRQSIFRALKSREVFATSGTRLLVRFFGGWDYPATACGDGNLAAAGYTGGVPMGELLGAAQSASPQFLVYAQRDPASAGLATLQIIKGWVENDELKEEVFTVREAGSPDGTSLLCAVWTDIAFVATDPAFYYARALEVPTDRWSTLDCQLSGVDCSMPDKVPPEFTACCDGSLPETIQERAWSSPIWYEP